MRRHSEVEVDSPKVDSQLSSETQSLSNESQGSETESKKLKTFLNYYNITLPDNTQTSTDIAKNSEANYTTKTYDELKNCEASEYISLGLNSTASNSRSASPSNSMDADIEWKKPADLMITNGKSFLTDSTQLVAFSLQYSSANCFIIFYSLKRKQLCQINQFSKRWFTTDLE